MTCLIPTPLTPIPTFSAISPSPNSSSPVTCIVWILKRLNSCGVSRMMMMMMTMMTTMMTTMTIMIIMIVMHSNLQNQLHSPTKNEHDNGRVPPHEKRRCIYTKRKIGDFPHVSLTKGSSDYHSAFPPQLQHLFGSQGDLLFDIWGRRRIVESTYGWIFFAKAKTVRPNLWKIQKKQVVNLVIWKTHSIFPCLLISW